MTLLGSLFQCSATISVKKLFLVEVDQEVVWKLKCMGRARRCGVLLQVGLESGFVPSG